MDALNATPNMNENPDIHRIPQADYPGLHALLDDVVVLGVWVQRQALRWLPGPPDPEEMELAWLERYLTDLERAAGVAREKVKWRRLMCEAAREREEDACLNLPDFDSSNVAPIATRGSA